MTKALDAEYRSIIESLEGDREGRELARRAIDCSTAVYHGRVVDTLYAPKLWDAPTVRLLRQAAETTHAILCKAVRRYREDPSYRAPFGFDPELERLICLDPGYPQPIPMARVDIFLNEETGAFKFCEFNTDGSSAMNEDRELGDALALTPAYQEMARRHHIAPFALFDPFVTEFSAVYRSFVNAVDNPHVAIVDFLDVTTPNEIEIFRRRFAAAGYECRIIDARALSYARGALTDEDGWRVDAIYRRAVTSDCLAHRSEIDDLVRAYEDHAVCLVGGFATQVAHCKNIFEVLRLPASSEMLTADERRFVEEHVPYTTRLDLPGTDLDQLVAEREQWLIKPSNSYGADSIFAGCTTTDDEWRRVLADHQGMGYVLQEFAPLYATPNLQQGREPGQPVNPEWADYHNLTGLYLYNGHFAGTYSRASRQKLISDAYGGATALSLAVDPEPDAPALREGGLV